MASNFRLVEGVSVSNIEGIHEAFCPIDKGIMANVSAEKIYPLVIEYLKAQNDTNYFVLELPCNRDEEIPLRKNNFVPFHKNIYYLDRLEQPETTEIMEKYGEILINDGMLGFGFGSPFTKDEIFISTYKVVFLFSNNVSRYLPVFEKLGISMEKTIETVRDRVDKDHPGERSTYKKGSDDRYKVRDDLVMKGLYFGETVEDQ